jgi:hypothetical protein
VNSLFNKPSLILHTVLKLAIGVNDDADADEEEVGGEDIVVDVDASFI